MEAARNREIDCILVWKFNRFARSTLHFLVALEEFDHLVIQSDGRAGMKAAEARGKHPARPPVAPYIEEPASRLMIIWKGPARHGAQPFNL